MSNTIRTFLAVKINDEICNALKDFQNQLKKLNCNIKWVDPLHIHLTLKFLGEVKQKRINDVSQTLSQWAKSCPSIETTLTKPGAFPSIEQPKTIWAGLSDDNQQIAKLASTLEEALGNIGFKKEKKEFTPHITIGRMRTSKNAHLLSQALSNFTFPEPIAQTIKKIILYKSTLTSTGPIYKKLDEFLLK